MLLLRVHALSLQVADEIVEDLHLLVAVALGCHAVLVLWEVRRRYS